jgi:hypothetical protein
LDHFITRVTLAAGELMRAAQNYCLSECLPGEDKHKNADGSTARKII